MRLQIVGHPLQRMAQRGISRADIESAVRNAHTVYRTARSVTYIGPGQDGRDLKVWVLPPGLTDPEATIIVKSAAWRDQEV